MSAVLFSQFYTVVVVAVALWLVLTKISRFRCMARPMQAGALVVLFLALLLPIANGSAGTYLFGVIGQPSVVVLLLLMDSALAHFRGRAVVGDAERQILYAAVAGIGIVFYALALGVSPFDPYALGYRPWLPGAVLLLAGVLAYIKDAPGLLLLVAIPLVCFALRVLESPNLWDYYVDPLLVLYASVRISQQIRSGMLRSRPAP